MAAAMTGFAVNDTFFKLLGETVPLFQALALRGVVTVALMLIIARIWGQLTFRYPPREWRLVLVRMLSEVAAAYFFLTALFNMDLANITAILQALPLTVTLAGALFLGEAVGWRRMAAILVGFVGVLMIVQPGTEGFTIYSLYGLATVASVTLRDLVVRRISIETPSIMVAAISAMGVTMMGVIGAPFQGWAEMGVREWGLLAGSAVFVVIAYLCAVMAMRVGEIGFVAPFRYTSLVVALILGAVVFGTFPNALTLAGAALVVASGLFTLWRERRLRQRGAGA